MSLRTITGTPCCQGTTQKKAWGNPLAPMAQCKHAAEKGYVTCRAHRRDEVYRRDRLTPEQREFFGPLVLVLR